MFATTNENTTEEGDPASDPGSAFEGGGVSDKYTLAVFQDRPVVIGPTASDEFLSK